jgi:hypothetical protein
MHFFAVMILWIIFIRPIRLAMRGELTRGAVIWRLILIGIMAASYGFEYLDALNHTHP